MCLWLLYSKFSGEMKLDHEHFVKSVRIRSFSDLYFSPIGLILRISVWIYPYSVRIRENADQENSEYGHFSRSGSI